MPGQKLFIGNKHPGFYMDKYGIYIYSVPADIITVTIIVSAWLSNLQELIPFYIRTYHIYLVEHCGYY